MSIDSSPPPSWPPTAAALPPPPAPPGMGRPPVPGPGSAVLAPPDGKLKGEDARAACLAVPYLGPDPSPSRVPGRILIAIVGVILLVRFVVAALYLEQSQRLREVAEGAVRPGTIDALDRTDGLIAALGGFHLLLIIASVVCWFTWRAFRRPKAVVERDGEAYVESPLRWVRGTANRWWLGVSIGAGVLANSLARSAAPSSSFDPPTPAELATSRMWLAASSLLFAAAWISWALVVRRSEALLAERVALSPAHRAGAVATPHFLPVPKADSDSWDSGRSEGIGWILRTAGLVLTLMVAPLLAIGGFLTVLDGQVGGVPFFVVGAAGTALAVRSVLRRRTTKRTPSATSVTSF